MSGYTLTLAMITGLVIFGAIWIAFYIARQIVVPIQRLAEGARAVAGVIMTFSCAGLQTMNLAI